MTTAAGVLKRPWSFPVLVRHESLLVLSKSFLGVPTAGVSFDLLQFSCSVSSSGPCFPGGPNGSARASRR